MQQEGHPLERTNNIGEIVTADRVVCSDVIDDMWSRLILTYEPNDFLDMQ
jgi:hypothetical protein